MSCDSRAAVSRAKAAIARGSNVNTEVRGGHRAVRSRSSRASCLRESRSLRSAVGEHSRRHWRRRFASCHRAAINSLSTPTTLAGRSLDGELRVCACSRDAALVIRIGARGFFRIASRCACESRRGAAVCGEFGSGVDARTRESEKSASCAVSANDCELIVASRCTSIAARPSWWASHAIGSRETQRGSGHRVRADDGILRGVGVRSRHLELGASRLCARIELELVD